MNTKTVDLLSKEINGKGKPRILKSSTETAAATTTGPRALADTSICPICNKQMTRAKVGLRGSVDAHDGWVCEKDRVALPVADRDLRISANLNKLT